MVRVVGFPCKPWATSITLSDEIPLNKSFDTQETSDSLRSQNNSTCSNTSVMTVWGLNESSQQQTSTLPAEQQQRRTSLSSEETLQVRNTSRRGTAKKLWRTDLATHYSPSLGITFESVDGEEIFCDEPEPRAVILPCFPIPATLEVREAAQDPEFFDNMRGIRSDDNMISSRSDLNLRWKDSPKGCEEKVETISVDGVWTDERLPPKDPNSLADSIEATRARAHAALERASRQENNNCHEIVWNAWGCNDRKTRRSAICIMLMFLATTTVIGFLTGLIMENKTTEPGAVTESRPADAQNDGYGWIGDDPENRPFDNPGDPPPPGRPATTPTPTFPAMPPPSQTSAPTKSPSPLTKRPVLDTVPPDLPRPTRPPTTAAEVPTRGPAAGPVETTKPTRAPVARPTAKPVVITTSSPTRSPAQVSSPCQSSLTVDKACYVESQDLIIVDFINCDPQDDDWVGIWLASEDPEDLSESFYTWAWSCGTQSCLGAPTTMRMAFKANGLGFNNFRAFLVHESPEDEPYFSHAMSEPFTVAGYCSR